MGLIIVNTNLFAQNSSDIKEERYNQAIALIEGGSYSFIADFAYPQKGRQVNLISNPNYFTVNGQEVKAEMPYFGVVNSGAASFGSGGGINIEATIEDLSVNQNEKKRRIIIRFRVKKGTEVLNCTFTVNSLESTTLVINSSIRETIRYSGKLSALK